MGETERTRRFIGATPQEAMAQAREALGTDALILGQREVVELVVAPPAGAAPAASPPARGNPLLKKAYGLSVLAGDEAPADADAIRYTLPAAPDATSSLLSDIQARLIELERLAKRSDRPHVPEALTELYLRMLDHEVAEDLARHLVETLAAQIPPALLHDREAVRDAMVEAMARLIPVDGGIRVRGGGVPTVVALVGPTGVGKTTSIAKLAMQLKVHRKCNVGLITEDTTRPGGTEQLRAVAQLLNIPLVVADTVDRIRLAIQRARDRDVILVDTAGRVPRHEGALRELAGFLEAIAPDEVHLALCSVSGSKHVLDVLERFSLVRFDRVLFTKLDEAASYGLILNVAAHIDRGVSYVTTGQDYMENIETGDPKRLAALILGAPLAAPGLDGCGRARPREA